MGKSFRSYRILCVQKPAAGGKWSKIADVGTSELKYKDSKVTANASYRYTVKAYYEASGKRYSGKYKTGDVIKAAPAVQKVTSVKSGEKMESVSGGSLRKNVTAIIFTERKRWFLSIDKENFQWK